MAELSAGNQRRVQFAAAVAADPEILIIDEPTNYLDLDTTEALEAALATWNGTLLVATTIAGSSPTGAGPGCA